MGNISQELKEIKKRAAKKEVETRYHLVRVKAGSIAHPGWLVRSRTRAWYTEERIQVYLTRGENGSEYSYMNQWYMYRGEKPSPKWGPVCP